MVAKDESKIAQQAEDSDLMDRRKAIKKMGYRTLSAATMMVLLNTPQAVMATPPDEPENPNTPSDGVEEPIWK